MATTEDILLRILGDASPARVEIVQFKTDFEQAMAAAAEAAKRPDFDPLSAEAKELAANVQRAGLTFTTAFNKARTETTSLRTALEQSGKSVEELNRELNKVGGAGTKGIESVSAAFGKLKGVLATVGIALGVRELFQVGVQAVQTGVQLEALQAQLDSAAGSAEGGAEAYAFVRENANRLGQSYFALGEATARFDAATRQSTLTLEQRRFILEKTFEASRVLNLSEQRLGNTLLALEQIASKGTVSLEELRRQLGDNIPGAAQILANQLGVSIKELFRMVEAGELLATDALPALARGFEETFGPGLASALDTTAAKLGQVQNVVTDVRAAFAAGLADELRSALQAATEGSDDLVRGAAAAGEASGFLARALAYTAASAADAGRQYGDFLAGETEAFLTSQQVEAQHRKTAEALLLLAERLPVLAEREGSASLAAAAFADVLGKLQSQGALSGENLERVRAVAEALAASFEEGASPALDKLLSGFSDLVNESLPARDRLSAVAGQIERIAETSEGGSGAFRVLAAGLTAFAGSAAPTEAQASSLQESITALINAAIFAGETVPDELLEARRAVEEIASAIESEADRAAAAAEKLEARYQDFTRGLERDAAKAAEQALFLARSLGDLESLGGESLDNLRDATQKALDGFAAFGGQVPEDLAELARQIGATTSTVEEELKKQERAAKKAADEEEKAVQKRIDNYRKLVEAIREVSEELGAADNAQQADLQARAAELRAEIAGLEGQPLLSTGDVNRLEELKTELRDVERQLERLAQGFDQATASVEDINSAIRDLLEGNAEAFAALDIGSQAAITNLLGRLQQFAQEGTATGQNVRGVFEGISDVLQSAGVDTAALEESFGLLEGQSLDVRDVMERVTEAVKKAAAGEGALGEEAKTTTEELEEQKKKLEEVVEAIDKLAERGVAGLEKVGEAFDVVIAKCHELRECIAETADVL